MSFRKICVVRDRRLERAFRELGHEVLHIQSDAPFLDINAELERAGFAPDLVVQSEGLAARQVLLGLDSLNCLRVFWSWDTHLNAFWQRHYGRLFDLVLTTQRDWLEPLSRMGLPRVRVLTWSGFLRDWTPWRERRHDLAFVGRLTEHRPARNNLVDFLRGTDGARIESDISYAGMQDVYAASRLVPNESILAEVNLRLFEAASCGCLVLGQDLGQAQDECFAPGREIAVYRDVCELEFLIGRYLRRPEQAEVMARAAWERLRAEHLPVHRAAALLREAESAPRVAATGRDAEDLLALAVFGMWESGRLDVPPSEIGRRLREAGDSPELFAARLRFLTLLGRSDDLREKLHAELVAGAFRDSLDASVAASMAALTLDDFDTAKLFWYRYKESCGRRGDKPASPAQLYRFWARELNVSGRRARCGFLFDPGRHLPTHAAECLTLAMRADPDDLEAVRAMDLLLARIKGAEALRLPFLSHLTLHEPDNWRAGLHLAMANLRTYRLDAGLEELCLAHGRACASGQEKHFLRVLACEDASGLARAAVRNFSSGGQGGCTKGMTSP